MTTLPEPQPGDAVDDPVSWEPSREFLKYSVVLLLAGSAFFLLLLRAVSEDHTVRAVGPVLGCLVAIATWFFLLRGQARMAVKVLGPGVWLVITGAAAFNGGVHTPVVVAYPLIIIFVGWLFGARAALNLAWLTAVTIMAFVLADHLAWLPPPPPILAPMYGVVQILVVALSVILITFLSHSYRNRLRELQRVGADLSRRTVALEASQAELQRAQAVAKVGSWIFDLGSDSMRLSAETCRIFGLPEGTRGSHSSYLSRVPAQDRAALELAWQGALLGHDFEHEHRILVGKKIRWVRQTAELELAADGRVLRAVGIAQDITEREKAAEKLRLLASVFTHAREGILITAVDATVIDVNAAFVRITGYGRDEVLGRNPRFLSSGRQGQEFYAAMWGDLLALGHWYGEVWNRRKNGEIYAQLQTISAVRDASGTITQYVALFSDITSLKENESKLERSAHYDALTGLPNRVLLADRLHQSMAQAQRRGQHLAVVFFDLDGFKGVNDQHGHGAGDQLLIHVSARMKQALREGDTLARLGGDEFVAVLLDLDDLEASTPMLLRLLAAAAQPLRIGEIVLQVSASLGVSFYPQTQDMDADQLLRQADQAMYRAKLAGKNRYHAFAADS
jgi:diguanylate cyclase (GGDEF)-like protein/PAS domain S-box-containing protein